MEEIFSRVSVRRFTDQKVEKEKQERLLRAAMQAPSGGNEQPWEFLIIEEKSSLDKLSKFSPFAGPVAKAPMAVVVLCNQKRLQFPELWQQDLGAATENILLEAVHLGLGGVWLGVAPLKERMEYIKEQFSLPDYMEVFAVLPIGYPANETRTNNRYDEARVHYETF